MALILDFLEIILHIDKYLDIIFEAYGTWIYAILFIIIFLETGIVITPFLPGDSLVFAVGAFAAQGSLNVLWLFILLSSAAILGDTVNYWIGYHLGPKVFHEKIRFLKKEYLYKTEQFYEKHGAKTIILARYIPIIRTFAPFVAGIGKMNYGKFITYNILGGITWIALFVFGGYYFGNIPAIKRNFTLVILIIILISFIPVIKELWMHYRKKKITAQSMSQKDQD
ncbi:DedA family protein [Candidatus Woesearchaeota archaeon]|nr:DedA family protein [Candidatus Woesearchaeota archaeon]